MEDTDSKRRNEVIESVPHDYESAVEMLNQVDSLLNNLKIKSPFMSGNVDQGFAYNEH